MGYWRFKAINLVNGVVARVHGNIGKRKKLGLSLKQIEDIVQFILNYAGVCGERERDRQRERERRGDRQREREREEERERAG